MDEETMYKLEMIYPNTNENDDRDYILRQEQ